MEHLRPLERRVLRMHEEGLSSSEIAARIRRSPDHVDRIIKWTEIPRTRRPANYGRALEARVLALRGEGLDRAHIGRMFKRSAANIRQVEALAHYRRAVALLRSSD